MWKLCTIWLATLALAAGGLSEIPHPRLWLPKAAESSLLQKLADDPLAARMNEAAIIEAGKILEKPTCRYDIPDGRRLLTQSRLALHNIMLSSWAWRMTGKQEFRLRTIAELEAACSLKDWNPSHFLDTAEMATAVATGYDWLHETLTPEQRTMCEKAILEKALKPAEKLYDHKGWWSEPRNNWSQVCGSGIALGAAAIAGHDGGISGKLFDRGLELVEKCGRFYQPEGMYPEGPGYWHYGTDYHVILLAACPPLHRVTNDDPILRKGGDAIMHLTGPSGYSFNFADGGAKHEVPTAGQVWLASHFNDPVQARHVRTLLTQALDAGKGRLAGDRFLPLSILWLPAAPATGGSPARAAVYQGEQAMAMLGSGADPDASWIAVKGGTPAASHGHMDVGSFVYDTHGTRWIHDLGSENYNLPGYFGSKRWNYYRLQNRSHNTLEIDGRLQNPEAEPCQVVASSLTGNPLAATIDLSDAYAGAAAKVIRKATLNTESGVVRVEDEVTEPAGAVVWRAFTDAKIKINGAEVTLSKKGKSITLRRISDAGEWSVGSAKPPDPRENQNESFQAVVLTAPKSDRVTLAVDIQP